MGSQELEEEELVQMVRDFIESESPSSPSFASSQGLTFNQQPTYLTLQEILGSVEDTEEEVLQKVLKYLRNKNTAGKTTNLKKWLVMRLRIDGYDASLCRTSWVTTFNCPGGSLSISLSLFFVTLGFLMSFLGVAGDYEYIDIMMQDDNGGVGRLIVDIDFKSQFELARPTSSYAQLTDTLPSIFVGCETKLNKIISILCTAAKQSLKERGLHVPPWRRTSYMQSKWLSDNCQKVRPTPRFTSNRDLQK
ncbi:uncharacterized protein LOC122087731 isoform X1 [Macadamia integrifolia]|uniref:uncharacterized protein LOC122087731 isoform X1 n=1 Tax=Macadamia integrifolia TaxID=60698 RepID=UPI001C5010D9|nr:uncharacterized protein LOC122087731 isoform X1 [Macadamia integrifolia]